MLGGAAADVSGATVYTCSERASDAEAARIAARENAADKAAGVEDKAAGARRRRHPVRPRSGARPAPTPICSRAASSRELQGTTRLNHNPERSAGFVVLKAPDFPSVLVELGYLSNPKDVQSMNSPEWRARTASAMADAVDRFFAPAHAGGRARPPAPTRSPLPTSRGRPRRAPGRAGRRAAVAPSRDPGRASYFRRSRRRQDAAPSAQAACS